MNLLVSSRNAVIISVERCIQANTVTQFQRYLQVLPDMSKVLKPVVICGPSGVGKSTLLKKLMKEYPECFAFSTSHTTRKPRPMEIDGKDYYFVPVEKMQKLIDEGAFVEHTNNFGNLYGTSKQAIQDIIDSGRICILDIDVKGVKNVKQCGLNPKYIFIKPPSFEELTKRLRGRGTESDESFKKRIQIAKDELAYGDEPGAFDYQIVNADLNTAYTQLKTLLEEDIKLVSKK